MFVVYRKFVAWLIEEVIGGLGVVDECGGGDKIVVRGELEPEEIAALGFIYLDSGDFRLDVISEGLFAFEEDLSVGVEVGGEGAGG